MDDGAAERAKLVDALKRAFAERVTSAPSSPRASLVTSGISFTPELLEAVLAGRKTQTRRPIRPAPASVVGGVPRDASGEETARPYRVGETLWVREKWARDEAGGFVFAIDATKRHRWLASRYMPRKAARYGLHIHRVVAERLSAIDDAGAASEGIQRSSDATTLRDAFVTLWDSIYGETEFASKHDPWVWAVGFELTKLEDVTL